MAATFSAIWLGDAAPKRTEATFGWFRANAMASDAGVVLRSAARK
jgi:hypothetical protein